MKIKTENISIGNLLLFFVFKVNAHPGGVFREKGAMNSEHAVAVLRATFFTQRLSMSHRSSVPACH